MGSPALTRLLRTHRAELAPSPAQAARRLWAVTLATAHPMLSDPPMRARDAAHLFLHGVRADPTC